MADKPELPPGTPAYYTERVERFGEFIAEFREESDRGCAVLVMCVLEESLQDMFKALLANEGGTALANMAPPGGLKKILENAVSLGLLSERQRRSFKALADVRNKFAHRPLQKLTFETPDIESLLRSVPTAVEMTLIKPNDPSARGLFVMSAAILWIVMAFKIPTIKRLEPALDPPTAGMPGYT